MSNVAPQRFDVLIAGGGIVGSSCALACAQAGQRVALVERDVLGSGATAAGMGHLAVMDDSDAQFALTSYSQAVMAKAERHASCGRGVRSARNIVGSSRRRGDGRG